MAYGKKHQVVTPLRLIILFAQLKTCSENEKLDYSYWIKWMGMSWRSRETSSNIQNIHVKAKMIATFEHLLSKL